MRNPSIKTYGLSWAWPAWTGNFTNSPWNSINLAANYTINWLNCARHTYNIDIDYIGSWNERCECRLPFGAANTNCDGLNSTRVA